MNVFQSHHHGIEIECTRQNFSFDDGFQSHHHGIEISWLGIQREITSPSNRTIMELK